MKSGNLNFLETSGPVQACNGTDLLFVLKFRAEMQCKSALHQTLRSLIDVGSR